MSASSPSSRKVQADQVDGLVDAVGEEDLIGSRPKCCATMRSTGSRSG
jgi:hypothetical protein